MAGSTSAASVQRATVFVLLAVAVSCARGPAPPAGSDGELSATIAEVEAGRRTTPIIMRATETSEGAVTFLVKEPGGQTPRIVSDATGWGSSEDAPYDTRTGTMTPVGTTGWYRLDARVAPGARVEYLVVHGESDYRVDPNNPRRAWSPSGYEVSELVTPDFEPPRELLDPPAEPRGTTIEATMASRALGGTRRVLVYLPAGYHDGGAYPVAVLHAGWRAAHEGQAPRVLDWLIAHREVPPIVVMFLESYVQGDASNHEGPPLRAFLTREVPGWLASRYSVSARSGDWAVIAISYGAKDALDAALAPDRGYGRVGLLIPGRRLTPADLETFALERHRRLRVAVLAGRYDALNLPAARDTARVLRAAGHDVDYLEVPEGHNPTTWRNHLSDVFVSLFGQREVPGAH